MPAILPSFMMANSIDNLALLHQRRAGFFRNDVVPVHAHGLQHARQVRTEIDALGVAQNFQVALHASVRPARAGAVVATAPP